MHDDELRALLRAEAESAPRPGGVRSGTVRKARLLRAAFVSTSIVTVLAAGVAGTLATRSLSDGRNEVADDSPDRTVRPSPDCTPAEARECFARDARQERRASYHDPIGDLVSEGSGDRGAPARSPAEPRSGTDLTGFSMARVRTGPYEINFGTRGPVPRSLEEGERLSFVLTADPLDPEVGFGAITAELRGAEWVVRVRNGDVDSEIPARPEIVRDVLNLVLDAEEVPRAMLGRFRWHAFSEWHPTSGATFTDYCPDEGFRIFGGSLE